MNDEMQELWQQDNSPKENHKMWMQLIQEKRTGFDDLVRAGNQAEYVVALIFGPLLAMLAWRAKFPWVQAGFGLLAATFIVLAIATWAAHRPHPRQNDRSLREHLEALIATYDRRIGFLGSGKFWVSLPLSAGLTAVILGIPHYFSSMGAWSFVCVLLAAFWGAQWISYQRGRELILQKREDAERLLQGLLAS
jgi:hypothetical protein